MYRKRYKCITENLSNQLNYKYLKEEKENELYGYFSEDNSKYDSYILRFDDREIWSDDEIDFNSIKDIKRELDYRCQKFIDDGNVGTNDYHNIESRFTVDMYKDGELIDGAYVDPSLDIE